MRDDEVLRRDAEDLARLGYAQQLFREMGGFSNFAISFSIISVLTGAVLLYGYGLKLAGPIVNTVGVRLTARLNDISVYWHIAGGAVIVLLLALFAKHHNDLAFLFRFVNTV